MLLNCQHLTKLGSPRAPAPGKSNLAETKGAPTWQAGYTARANTWQIQPSKNEGNSHMPSWNYRARQSKLHINAFPHHPGIDVTIPGGALALKWCARHWFANLPSVVWRSPRQPLAFPSSKNCRKNAGAQVPRIFKAHATTKGTCISKKIARAIVFY